MYIAAYGDLQMRKFIYETYYRDDGSVCKQVLYRQPYGVMYFGEGDLRLVPKRVAVQFLDAIQEGKSPVIELHDVEGNTEDDAKDSLKK
jgi:hypothetical protein